MSNKLKLFIFIFFFIASAKIAQAQNLARNQIPEQIQKGYLFGRELELGQESIDVAYLQLCLAKKGFYQDKVNGYFGESTRAAVGSLEKKYKDFVLEPWGFSEPTGKAAKHLFFKLNELCYVSPEGEAIGGKPEQLFDINFELDDNLVESVRKLTSRVIFISFGRAPTPVDLTFIILDENGDAVYIGKDYIVVETEAVLTKKFKNAELSPGRYKVMLYTLYNINVEDNFQQGFEIFKPANPIIALSLWYFIFPSVIFSFGFILVLFIALKKK